MREIAVENPDLSFGQLLYEIQRQKYFKKELTDLRKVSDKDFATALEKAQSDLKDEKRNTVGEDNLLPNENAKQCLERLNKNGK